MPEFTQEAITAVLARHRIGWNPDEGHFCTACGVPLPGEEAFEAHQSAMIWERFVPDRAATSPVTAEQQWERLRLQFELRGVIPSRWKRAAPAWLWRPVSELLVPFSAVVILTVVASLLGWSMAPWLLAVTGAYLLWIAGAVAVSAARTVAAARRGKVRTHGSHDD